MKFVLLIFIFLCLSMLNIVCLRVSLVYFYHVFFVLSWFINLWLRHVIVRPFFFYLRLHEFVVSSSCSLVSSITIRSWPSLIRFVLCIYSVNGYFITGNVYNFEAPIHNNIYCASSRVEYFVVLIFCFVYFRILNLSIVTLILIRPFSLRKECQGCSV